MMGIQVMNIFFGIVIYMSFFQLMASHSVLKQKAWLMEYKSRHSIEWQCAEENFKIAKNILVANAPSEARSIERAYLQMLAIVSAHLGRSLPDGGSQSDTKRKSLSFACESDRNPHAPGYWPNLRVKPHFN